MLRLRNSLEESSGNKHYFEMNFIFRTYPEHFWFTDWTLEPRGCNSTFRENSTPLFFRTQEVVGRLVPNVDEPEWVLQIPIPQNSRNHLLFNGFCAYYERRKARYGTEVITPEPGVLWGRFTGISAPVLATDQPLVEGDGFHWLEGEDASVLLAVRNDLFCVVTKSRLQTDALELAEHYFEQDLEDVLVAELERRKGTKTLFEEMSHHDSLAAICVETMMKSLRPGEGSIPLAWCQSSGSRSPMLDVNEIHPLAMAWRLIDIGVAEELVTCILRIQTNSGAIPVLYAPHTTHSVLEAPKPLLAKTVEAVWEVRKDDELLNTLLPPLRRHLQWLLHHFDPKKRGLHCWKNSREPLVPELYESDMATVDLTVLLLTEIEALNRLRRQSSLYHSEADFFEEEHASLKQNLMEQFWNDKDSAFSNAVLRDRIVSVSGLPSFMPLLWNKLPDHYLNAILDHVHESGALPGGRSVLTWRKSALDENSFPVLQQMLIFEALKTADQSQQLLRDFSRISLQEFVEWHSLSLQQDNQLNINPVMAAYIINVQALQQYRYFGQGTITGFLLKGLRKVRADHFDLLVVAATIFTLFSVHLIYDAQKAPPPLQVLEAQMNNAYAKQDGNATLEQCAAIIRYYPDDSAMAKLLAANISMLNDKPADAAKLYESVRETFPDSPGPMISLGLAYQLQGRFEEAEKNYYEFCYLFDEIFPEQVAEVNTYRDLMQEGFRTPPKWSEIYRYKFMHEL